MAQQHPALRRLNETIARVQDDILPQELFERVVEEVSLSLSLTHTFSLSLSFSLVLSSGHSEW
jgi:hypothetical protein